MPTKQFPNDPLAILASFFIFLPGSAGGDSPQNAEGITPGPGKKISGTMVSVNTKGNTRPKRSFDVARTVSIVMTLGIVAGLATLSKYM